MQSIHDYCFSDEDPPSTVARAVVGAIIAACCLIVGCRVLSIIV
jgi:hypothetical protein